MSGPLRARVAFVLKGYPRLSESFIAQEIAALEKRGLDILIVSLRQPAEARRHPVHGEIRAELMYLPEYVHREPGRVLRAWWRMRRQPAYRSACLQWLRDLRREPTANRARRFFQALVLAHELPSDVRQLHAHFLHTPASVARYAAALLGLPWSASAHAKDIWTSPEWDKREKLASCQWLVTCTACNRDHLAALAPAGRVGLVYHGIDADRFPASTQARSEPDGSSSARPVVLLSVGRLVEKKGTDILLDALALMPRELSWRLIHVGGGPLRQRLERQAGRLGIADRITWRGPQTQVEVLSEYRAAHIFALACRVADDGDRDGLPNVLMEAQSQGLPCVSTSVSAIAELIRHERTGIVVPPDSPQILAAALRDLICDPARRRALGEAGRARVAEEFALEANIEQLARKFGLHAATVRDSRVVIAS